jgi:acetyltransferase
MTIRNLEHAVHPKSVAVIGASVRKGSVGRVVISNIVNSGFEGDVWPVNPKYKEVAGRRCFSRIKDIPSVPDLAVIVTPPPSVPGLIHELGEKGTRVAVVITAGITQANGLRQAMLDAAKPFLFRIIGPNTVGLILPSVKLNASFAHMTAKPGHIALLSQSGAIATSLIDWAAENGVGFSQIVSLGDMADVDIADCLDMLTGDVKTRAIVMYLESIPHPRKFMSAARAAARLKPVIAIKPGRHAAAAKAAATHTGALSGADRVIDAAFRRAGILRVLGLDELFDATETIARFPPLEKTRAGIVTNGGGAGVLAVDRLMDHRGELAELSAETIGLLDKSLPANWSRANPVDIIGDASPERYQAAVKAGRFAAAR